MEDGSRLRKKGQQKVDQCPDPRDRMGDDATLRLATGMSATTRTRKICSTDLTQTQVWTGGEAQWQPGGLIKRHVQVFLHGQHAPSLRRGQQDVRDVVPLFR